MDVTEDRDSAEPLAGPLVHAPPPGVAVQRLLHRVGEAGAGNRSDSGRTSGQSRHPAADLRQPVGALTDPECSFAFVQGLDCRSKDEAGDWNKRGQPSSTVAGTKGWIA
ncbi:hypothetical protein ACIQUZ_35050 [Streptomyces griseus]|uniref:hypothetical protein n=1 Tax=Streptomyces griseus TaxID=1911 RepID=UPI00380BD86B